jgi:predicted negative regulator of RcsB-dependent stress response
MRNKIIVGIALIVVFVLGALSVRAWDHYEVEQRVRTEYTQYQERQKAEAIKSAEAKRQAVEAAEKARLQEECQAGVAAYEALTTTQKAGKTKPVCNLEQVE